MERSERLARALGRAGERMGDRIAAGARHGATALASLTRRMQISHETMGALAFRAGGLIGSTIRTGATAGAAIGGAAIVGGLYKVVSAGTQAEVLKTQLVQGRRGDVKAAEADMKWIADFAAKTPYDLAGVTKAFIDARGAGVDPMNGSLKAMGDAASALGKTYEDAIGMIQDAAMGSFDRLPEFQIKAAKQGEQVTFRYFDRSGKAMVKTIKDQGHNVERAITEILAEKFGGGMDAIAKTTIGKWDGLTDKITQRAAKVWDAGFGAEVKRQLDRANKAFDEAEKSGAADRWSASTGSALAGVTKLLGDSLWDQGADNIRAVGDAYHYLGKAIDYLASKRQALSGAMSGWSIMPPQFSILRNGMANVRAIEQAMAREPKKNYPDVPVAGRLPSSPYPRERAPRVPLARPARQSPLLPGQAPFKWPAPPKAKVEISLRTERGVKAETTKMKATGMDMDVNVGRMFSGLI
ncbi:hypothetical protein [Sphingomonas sp. VDB2]|uniref:hypothetical protein n=1 Tax=Sphingomonas sp. VDB2 TaxID=3228751 RepID=UPI003A7F6DF4